MGLLDDMKPKAKNERKAPVVALLRDGSPGAVLCVHTDDDKGGITIYHGDCLDILPHLEGLGGILTDPPYSSGGQYRSDRTQSTLTKGTYILDSQN